MVCFDDAYLGGEIGGTWRNCYMLELDGMRPVKAEALFRPGYEYPLQPLIQKHLLEYVQKARMGGYGEEPAYDDPKGAFFNFEEIIPNDNFCLTDSGMLYIYNPYEIASYDVGTLEAFIPMEELLPLVNVEYLQQLLAREFPPQPGPKVVALPPLADGEESVFEDELHRIVIRPTGSNGEVEVTVQPKLEWIKGFTVEGAGYRGIIGDFLILGSSDPEVLSPQPVYNWKFGFKDGVLSCDRAAIKNFQIDRDRKGFGYDQIPYSGHYTVRWDAASSSWQDVGDEIPEHALKSLNAFEESLAGQEVDGMELTMLERNHYYVDGREDDHEYSAVWEVKE
jgi:hypothetical protein